MKKESGRHRGHNTWGLDGLMDLGGVQMSLFLAGLNRRHHSFKYPSLELPGGPPHRSPLQPLDNCLRASVNSRNITEESGQGVEKAPYTANGTSPPSHGFAPGFSALHISQNGLCASPSCLNIPWQAHGT